MRTKGKNGLQPMRSLRQQLLFQEQVTPLIGRTQAVCAQQTGGFCCLPVFLAMPAKPMLARPGGLVQALVHRVVHRCCAQLAALKLLKPQQAGRAGWRPAGAAFCQWRPIADNTGPARRFALLRARHRTALRSACLCLPFFFRERKPGFFVIQGIVASVLASVLFGAIYYLSPFLAPLDGEQIFGWRVLVTLPLTTALVLWRGEWPRVLQLWRSARAAPRLALLLLTSAAMLGIQLWLFMWAPLQGRALPVSLGYFLLPLVMVLAGRVVFAERLSAAHRLATALATAGVAFELLRAGGVSWETWLVALGYPAYFVLRRRLGTDHLAGHWLDMVLLVPAALWFMLRAPSSAALVPDHPALYALLPLLGLLSAVALALYMAASRMLPMGLFGLLTYVEPVLLVLVALLLGESIAPDQWPTYALVFAAVGVLVLDGALQFVRERRRQRQRLAMARSRTA